MGLWGALLGAWGGGDLTDAQKVEKIESMYEGYKKLGFARVPEIRPEIAAGVRSASTTSSPVESAATISRCSFCRFVCGRMSRK